MSDMVERVGRAVCIALGHEPEEWAYSERVRERCRRVARAAIKAMREITIAEKGPGVSAYVKVAGECRPVTLKAAWEAIIDAALKGEAE